VTELSKFEALERKITQAIEKVALLREEKKVLQERLDDVESRNASLMKEMDGLKKASAKPQGPDLKRIRGKVDTRLEKIEALEL